MASWKSKMITFTGDAARAFLGIQTKAATLEETVAMCIHLKMLEGDVQTAVALLIGYAKNTVANQSVRVRAGYDNGT